MPKSTEAFFELSEGPDGWHWCLWSGNGRRVCRNAEPYGSRKYAIQAIRLLRGVVENARVILRPSPDTQEQEASDGNGMEPGVSGSLEVSHGSANGSDSGIALASTSQGG